MTELLKDRLKRAFTKLSDEGVAVRGLEPDRVIVGPGEKYVLTIAQLLELMDNDQLTWQGIKELHRELNKRLIPLPASSL